MGGGANHLFRLPSLGETLVSTVAGFDPAIHVTKDAAPQFRTHYGGSRSVSLLIPWTKTTHELGAAVIVTGRDDRLDPCAAVQRHLEVNAAVPSWAPLFAYATSDGSWKHLTKSVFLAFVNEVWLNASLQHIHGHSFRIGGAVELLLAGVPPKVVAVTGGWSSLAFLIYRRRMEEILPMCTSKAYNAAHVSQLAAIFEDFRIQNRISNDDLSLC